MIKEDREVLAKLGAVNQHMGEIVLRLLSDPASLDTLPASELREVGHGLCELARELVDVGHGLYARANVIDGTAAVTAPQGTAPSRPALAAADTGPDPASAPDGGPR